MTEVKSQTNHLDSELDQFRVSCASYDSNDHFDPNSIIELQENGRAIEQKAYKNENPDIAHRAEAASARLETELTTRQRLLLDKTRVLMAITEDIERDMQRENYYPFDDANIFEIELIISKL